MWEYNGVKKRHPDDMILFQMGDFFEIYDEDAKKPRRSWGCNWFSVLFLAIAM